MVVHPVDFERVNDLVCCQYFRINEVVQTHLLEELLVLGQEVFVVIDTCQCFLRAELVRHETGGHVLGLIGRNGDEQVTIPDADVFEVMDRSRAADFGQHVVFGIEVAEFLDVLIHQTDFHVFAGQQLSQVPSYFSSSCNNNAHIPSLSNRSMWYSSFVLPCSTN